MGHSQVDNEVCRYSLFKTYGTYHSIYLLDRTIGRPTLENHYELQKIPVAQIGWTATQFLFVPFWIKSTTSERWRQRQVRLRYAMKKCLAQSMPMLPCLKMFWRGMERQAHLFEKIMELAVHAEHDTRPWFLAGRTWKPLFRRFRRLKQMSNIPPHRECFFEKIEFFSNIHLHRECPKSMSYR